MEEKNLEINMAAPVGKKRRAVWIAAVAVLVAAVLAVVALRSAPGRYVFAGAMLFIIPPLLLYLYLQKYFVQSIERTGIVG